jgi:hypothetical protein
MTEREMQVQSFQTIWRRVVDRRWLALSIVVLGWSLIETVNLALRHNTGPELYGVLTAGLATAAGVANVALLRSSRVPVVLLAAVLVLWAVVAFGGLAGTVAHIVGPVPGHGPIDLRPRPIAAPLIFCVLGLLGGAALFLGRRAKVHR